MADGKFQIGLHRSGRGEAEKNTVNENEGRTVSVCLVYQNRGQRQQSFTDLYSGFGRD
jgi:hypothetical protein